MPLVRAYYRNLGQCSILAREGTFFEKRTSKILFCIKIKLFNNFHKRGQRSIVERDTGLEYALLVASNSHISTTLLHPLWKNINDSKSYVLAVPIIMSFKVLKYFFSGKIGFFFYLLACGNKISNWIFSSEILTNTTVGFFHKKNNGLWLDFTLFES